MGIAPSAMRSFDLNVAFSKTESAANLVNVRVPNLCIETWIQISQRSLEVDD